MKIIAIAISIALLAIAQSASAQSQSQITIVSNPSDWYVNTPQGPAPAPEAFIVYPEITSIPGPIPEHWNVTRLDPWTEARVVWLNGGPKVVTWGSSRVLANWHEYRTPFAQMSNGKSFYSRDDLPMEHSMHAEFHMADRNHDARVTAGEHMEFFGSR